MKSPIWIAVIVAVVLGLLGSVYVVREDQTAMVLNLGKVVRSDIKPGLHFKVPVVETVRSSTAASRCSTPRRHATSPPSRRTSASTSSPSATSPT